MKVGEFSQPVLSEFGYHIIKLMGKQDFFPYDSVRNDIKRFIDARGIRERIVDEKLDSLVKVTPGVANREEVLDLETNRLSSSDNQLKYLVKEYHDGLLLYEISNRMVWDKAANDERGLQPTMPKTKKDIIGNSPISKASPIM